MLLFEKLFFLFFILIGLVYYFYIKPLILTFYINTINLPYKYN